MMRALVIAMLLLARPTFAQPAAPAPAEGGMMGSMEKMERAMRDAPMNGNPDHDFVTMMIPHHRGAIDMAEAELQNGRDPAMRRLARAIIRAQEREIASMRRWLTTHDTH